MLVLVGNLTDEDSCNSKIVLETGRRIRHATHYGFTAMH